MRFPYIALPTRRPVDPLGGALLRDRPLVAVEVRGPSGTRSLTATLDSGADDTLLPAYLAPRLGIDLAQAPEGSGIVRLPPQKAQLGGHDGCRSRARASARSLTLRGRRRRDGPTGPR